MINDKKLALLYSIFFNQQKKLFVDMIEIKNGLVATNYFIVHIFHIFHIFFQLQSMRYYKKAITIYYAVWS